MFNTLNAEDAPQPPKVLTTPLEIAGTLRMLQESHDPLIITFHERNQRFQSYLVEVDRDSKSLALDEMIPRDGERYLENGEAFRIEGFHDGVRVALAALPFGSMTTSVELRYLHFEERINTTFAGVRFHNMSGLVQRQVERFVYQLQREARRFDKDDDL